MFGVKFSERFCVRLSVKLRVRFAVKLIETFVLTFVRLAVMFGRESGYIEYMDYAGGAFGWRLWGRGGYFEATVRNYRLNCAEKRCRAAGIGV